MCRSLSNHLWSPKFFLLSLLSFSRLSSLLSSVRLVVPGVSSLRWALDPVYLPIHVAGLIPFGYVLCVAPNNNIIVRVAGPGSIAFLINDTVSSLREFVDLLLLVSRPS